MPAVLSVGMLVPMHAIGGARDLPVPAPLAIAGGTAALVVSFCVLILAWRSPRYDARPAARSDGRVVPAPLADLLDSTAFAVVVRALGFVFTAYVVWAMVAGHDLQSNPVFGVFYVILWVGIVPASLVFGRFFRAVSPARTLNIVFAKIAGADPAKGLYTYPARLGYWPAALGLFAFVWQELVNPNAGFIATHGFRPGVSLWLATYLGIMMIGSALYGDTWLARADPFEVYSSLIAKLSFWARRDDGTRVWRSPLANLATTVPRPGLVAVVAVLFGSTAFDSYKDSAHWFKILAKLGTDVQLTNTVALIGFCVVVGVTFSAATMATRAVTAESGGRFALPLLFAHSVVPIIVGYMTAHYLNYFIVQGQTTIQNLSDPMSRGQNLLGTFNWSTNLWLTFHPTFLATTKVLAVVVGHVVGVVAAHDRALALLPRKHHVSGQLGLLVVMVAYTATGLYLLFGA
ncbi:MAG: hypothetical protein JWQ74_1291 [Marmoricola sp.]|nr:hypothetical protein [Marmoricola sp.]